MILRICFGANLKQLKLEMSKSLSEKNVFIAKKLAF
jgi:hypothetical protein